VNDLSSEIIEKIDEYEKEIIEFNKTNSKSLDALTAFAKDLESFHTVNNEYLKQYEVDDAVLTKSNKDATNLMKKVDLEIDILKDVIFNGKIFKFEKSKEKINKSILGSTKNSKCNINSIILSNEKQVKDLIFLCKFPSYVQ